MLFLSIMRVLAKWLRRILIAFMLGFSNVINEENKYQDAEVRTEQRHDQIS